MSTIVAALVIFVLFAPPADYMGGYGDDEYVVDGVYEYECDECGEVWEFEELVEGFECENRRCDGWCTLIE